MNTAVLDERDFFKQLQKENERTFLRMIDQYEAYIAPIMRSNGYKRVNQKERTVVFSFGEMTFTRSRWKKGNDIRFPVDEKLGLVPRARFSTELLYQLTKLANFMPYRKVVIVMELLKEIYISKNSVQTALEKAGDLLQEQEEYRILSLPEESSKKKKPEVLYIEGDGVWVKQSSPDQDKKATELAHFIVHTGPEDNKRKVLKDKLQVVSSCYSKAKEKLLDLIYNHFEIGPDTLIVTNSDGGCGYSPNVFKDIARAFRPGEHIHFWDAYHVNQLVKMYLRPFSPELTNLAFKAIKNHKKSKLETVLDTAESLIEEEDRLENFQRFRRRLLRNFAYTKTPATHGISSKGIGIMESQHRKITYRMKNNGMYWSKKGADTMSQTILLNYANTLRDLFFGQWRAEYAKIQATDYPTVRPPGAFSTAYKLPQIHDYLQNCQGNRRYVGKF